MNDIAPRFVRRFWPVLLLLVSLAAAAQAPEELSAAVARFTAAQGDSEKTPFEFAMTDLNGDGQPDAVVLLTSPNWCGSGGCTLLVFKGGKHGFTLVSDSSVTLEPIRKAQTSSHGWASLIVHSRGRGEVVLKYNGKRYPANPSTQPKVADAEIRRAEVLIQ